MREESSAARGALALSIAGILSKVISVAYTPLLIAILGDEGYGLYAKVLEVFLFIYAIATVGAQPAVAKVVAEFNAHGDKDGALRTLNVSRKFYFVVGSLAGIFMMLIAFPIANIVKSPKIAYGIIALGPCILITALLSAYRGYMQGNNNMKSIAISQIFEQFLNVIISLLCAFILMSFGLAQGVAGAQVGTSVGALFALMYLIYCFIKNDYEGQAFECDVNEDITNKDIRKKIILYSIPIIMSAGLQNLGGLIDMGNVTTRLASIGFEEDYINIIYGFYSKYKTLIGVPMVIITAIGVSILPVISKYRELRDKKEVRNNIRYGLRSSMSIAIPAAVGLAMVADPIYMVLYGNTRGAAFLKIGSFILVLMALTQIQTTILQGINKFYYILFTFSIGLLFKIGLNFIFVGIKSINIYGVLIGNCFWYLIPAVLNHRKICKSIKMRIHMITILFKPLLSSLVMALGIFIVNKPVQLLYGVIEPSRLVCIPVVILEVCVGVFIYASLMVYLGGIKRKDIESISPKLIRIMPRFMRMKLK